MREGLLGRSKVQPDESLCQNVDERMTAYEDEETFSARTIQRHGDAVETFDYRHPEMFEAVVMEYGGDLRNLMRDYVSASHPSGHPGNMSSLQRRIVEATSSHGAVIAG